MLYGYCIRRAGEPPPAAGLQGVAGAGVRLWEGHGVGLWLSEVESAVAAPAAELIKAHDHVVRAALRTATPLPLRFATHFRDAAEVEQVARSNTVTYLAKLDAVAGRAEFGITIHWSEAEARARLGIDPPAASPPATPATSGREYLQRLQQRRAGEERLRGEAERIVACVRGVVDLEGSTTCEILPEQGVAVRMAHLVHRDRYAVFRQQAESLAKQLPDMEIRLSGPWAPYSFV